MREAEDNIMHGSFDGQDASTPTRRCSWSAETLAAAGSSSASSASSSMRSARRQMRRLRREWLAEERARLEFKIRRCPYIDI